MHDPEKSDRFVVPGKGPNEAPSAEEGLEGRRRAKENPRQSTAHRTQSRESALAALERVRQVARGDREVKFTALLHHVTLDRLRAAYRRLNRRAVPGVDGVTWAEYGQRLEENLQQLLDRVHRGAYRARPTRRAVIPKEDGQPRLLGIAALEDKVLQGAVVEVLNAIYEEDFVRFSYGFRPGRSAHDALDALAVGLSQAKVNWVLDADIRGFFDAIDHEWLIRFLEHRIADRRVIRLIRKWLKAGVLEEGQRVTTESGTPQGATISPLLANIYLHYVLDLWVQRWRRNHERGSVVIVRYADDFVVGFRRRADAERFQQELAQRLRGFGLELHPEKTRLLEFGRFAAVDRQQRGEGKPETFDFLGFTHVCGKTREGKFLLLRRTSAKRKRAALRRIKESLRKRMHHAVPVTGQWLRRSLQGYFNYHAVPTNSQVLRGFRADVMRLWYRTLRRRSQRATLTWESMYHLAQQWLPPARILHPWPSQRRTVTI
jgi:group II intron reverse transcriptase/maturase